MFAAVIVGFATRRPVAKKAAPQTTTTYNFDYYPKANIYYNKTNNDYAFLTKEGSWQVVKSLPASFTVTLDKKVELKSTSANIWKENERHRMIYAVSLYASALDFKEPPRITPPPPVAKAETKEEKKEKPEVKKERGIKGFFKKIFKKKKEES